MAQKCKCCTHPDTQKIDRAIVDGQAHTQIAARYGLNNQSVRAHALNHLPKKLVKSVQKDEAQHATSILDGIHNLLSRTEKILDHAEAKGYSRLQLEAIKELRSIYELLSRIAATLSRHHQQEDASEQAQKEEQIKRGMETLTTPELNAYIQLTAKIHAANPEFELAPESRYVVDAMNVRNTSGISEAEPKNIQKAGNTRQDEPEPDPNELDDLELDDLELDELPIPKNPYHKIIPSADTDPPWRRQERRRTGPMRRTFTD